MILNSQSLFLASTKAFSNFEKNDFDYESFLRKKNLLDYGYFKNEFKLVYNPNARIVKYLKAEMPILADGFFLTGHGVKTRSSCGGFRGLKGTKENIEETHEIIFHSCNQLQCPICALKSCSVKALKIVQKFRDYIWFMLVNGFKDNELCPKHISFNPLAKHFQPDFSSSKNYRISIQEFAKEYIEPYMTAGVWFYHHHRFQDLDREKLKEFGHFHALGYGRLPHFKVFEQKHGFIYVNEGYKQGQTYNSLNDIFRVCRYELSHVIFPRNEIIRTTKRTESEIDYLAKSNIAFKTLGIDSIPITEFKKTKSMHSQCAYHYFGFMSPYKTRKLKERKIILPARSRIDNKKIYRVLDGYLLRVKTNLGTKVYTPCEAFEKGIKIDLDIEVKYFKSRLKFSDRSVKASHFLRKISIIGFNLSPVLENIEKLGVL